MNEGDIFSWHYTEAKEAASSRHDWVKSTLGHGETMCTRCKITNREAAVLGTLEHCDG